MEREICGWLICGDENRPCFNKPAHKGAHRDEAFYERKADYQRKYRDDTRGQFYERDNAAAKRRYAENSEVRERILEGNKKWRDESPEKVKELHKLDYDKNRERYLKNTLEWRINNPERRREQNKAAHSTPAYAHGQHAYRARKRGAPSEPWVHSELIELYGDLCWLCSGPLGEGWHADHIIPLSKEGYDIKGNLRPACKKCNTEKGNRIIGDPEVIASAYASMEQFDLSR